MCFQLVKTKCFQLVENKCFQLVETKCFQLVETKCFQLVDNQVLSTQGQHVVNLHRLTSPMESKSPSEPHMHTLQVTMRLQKELLWLVNRHDCLMGAV